MFIQVTQQYLDEGVPGVASGCPIALALYDMGYQDVRVDTNQINFRKPGVKKKIRVKTPKQAKDFISRYDEYDEEVEPFSFVLDEEVEHAHPGPD